jgi:serine/threonine protein kinase
MYAIFQMKMLGWHGNRCVVRMLGCMSRLDGTLGLVLEYCPGGNLLEHVQQIGSIGFEAIKKEEEDGEEATAAAGQTLTKKCRQFAHFAWQVCDGMLFLGTKHLVHRDLAARNVLLDAEPCAKVGEMGLEYRHCPISGSR